MLAGGEFLGALLPVGRLRYRIGLHGGNLVFRVVGGLVGVVRGDKVGVGQVAVARQFVGEKRKGVNRI